MAQIRPKMSLIHVFNLRYFRDDQDMLQSEPPTRSEINPTIDDYLDLPNLMSSRLKNIGFDSGETLQKKTKIQILALKIEILPLMQENSD